MPLSMHLCMRCWYPDTYMNEREYKHFSKIWSENRRLNCRYGYGDDSTKVEGDRAEWWVFPNESPPSACPFFLEHVLIRGESDVHV